LSPFHLVKNINGAFHLPYLFEWKYLRGYAPANQVRSISDNLIVYKLSSYSGWARMMKNKSMTYKISTVTSLMIFAAAFVGLIYSYYNPPTYVDPYVDNPSLGVTYNNITLSDAISQGLVEVQINGHNLNLLDLSFTSKSEEPLNLTVPSGTIFKSNSRSV
jgi:hypothetical protein